MAVPPFAVMSSAVELKQEPPETDGSRLLNVSPTPMALQALPPLLMSPTETAPPFAEAVATPPLPAEAVSMNWAEARLTAPTPTTAPANAALIRRFMAPLLPSAAALSSLEALTAPTHESERGPMHIRLGDDDTLPVL